MKSQTMNFFKALLLLLLLAIGLLPSVESLASPPKNKLKTPTDRQSFLEDLRDVAIALPVLYFGFSRSYERQRMRREAWHKNDEERAKKKKERNSNEEQ